MGNLFILILIQIFFLPLSGLANPYTSPSTDAAERARKVCKDVKKLTGRAYRDCLDEEYAKGITGAGPYSPPPKFNEKPIHPDNKRSEYLF